MNYLHIAGHLGADPEIRFTSSGQKVTTLRVAARAGRKGSEDNTIWWRVTVWGEQFDKMIAYLKKGSAVMAFGELTKPEIYTDKNGNPQISMSMTASNITFSPFGRSDRQQEGFKANSDEATSSTEGYTGVTSGQESAPQSDNNFTPDDEIPF